MSDEETEIKSEVNLDSSDAESALSSHLQIDEILKSISSLNSSPQINFPPKIEITPEIIKFKPTYPNVPVTQQIQISNKGKALEHFTINISGDKAFTCSTSEINIKPSSTYPIFLSFLPKKVQSFSASLIIEGRKSLALPITANCLHHPLVYSPENDKVWTFTRDPQTHQILFSNNFYGK